MTKKIGVGMILFVCGGLLWWQMQNFLDAKKVYKAIDMYNQTTQEALQLFDPVTTGQINSLLSGYEQSMDIYEYPDARWNYEMIKEFLSKKTENGNQELDINNQAPYKQATGNQNNGPLTTDNQFQFGNSQSGSRQKTLSTQETAKLQYSQQQLQNIQQHMSKDFNKQQENKNLYDTFGGGLFKQFFGGKDLFQQELPSQDPNIKDW